MHSSFGNKRLLGPSGQDGISHCLGLRVCICLPSGSFSSRRQNSVLKSSSLRSTGQDTAHVYVTVTAQERVACTRVVVGGFFKEVRGGGERVTYPGLERRPG